MEIELTTRQRKQLEPLNDMLAMSPPGTSTLAQVIWRWDGTCVLRVTLINAASFRKIVDIVGKPGALYRPPNNGVQPTAELAGSEVAPLTKNARQPAAADA